MELLTKKFWENVKKTFDEARQDPPVNAGDLDAPAQTTANDISSTEGTLQAENEHSLSRNNADK